MSLEGVDLLAGHQNLQQDWSLAMALSPLPGHQWRRILNLFRLVLLELSVGDEGIVLCSHQLLRHRQIENPGGITVHEFTRNFKEFNSNVLVIIGRQERFLIICGFADQNLRRPVRNHFRMALEP